AVSLARFAVGPVPGLRCMAVLTVVAAECARYLGVGGVELRVVVLVGARRRWVGEVSLGRGRHERRPDRQRARDRYVNPAPPLTSARMLTAGGRRSRRSRTLPSSLFVSHPSASGGRRRRVGPAELCCFDPLYGG